MSDRISSGPKYDRVCGFKSRTRSSPPNTTTTHHAGPVAVVVAVAVEAVRPLASGFWSMFKALPGNLRKISNSASVGQKCFDVNELLWWPLKKNNPCLHISYVSRFPKRIHHNMFEEGEKRSRFLALLFKPGIWMQAMQFSYKPSKGSSFF